MKHIYAFACRDCQTDIAQLNVIFPGSEHGGIRFFTV